MLPGERCMSDLVVSPPFLVLLSVSFSVLLYLIGSVISRKAGDTVGKLSSYACGEDLPPGKSQVNVRSFFLYVTFFMVFDISAFLLGTSFSSPGVYPLLFCGIIVFAVVTLLSVWREESHGPA
jgi:NADH:ubiquinone oxidoreductase subunit 3 (subunit A)